MQAAGEKSSLKYIKTQRTNTKSGSRCHEMSPNKEQKLPNNQVIGYSQPLL